MAAMVIQVPRRLTLESSVQFACKLRDLPESNVYVLDFGGVGRIEPFALLYLSPFLTPPGRF